jgi:predicted extracellular nuclease
VRTSLCVGVDSELGRDSRPDVIGLATATPGEKKMIDLNKICKAAALGLTVSAGLTSQADAALVINEFYAGGGNTGAQFNADFVELTNNGTSSVELGGLLVQYGSASGLFATNTFSTVTLPTFTLLPGQNFLIRGGGGTSGGAAFTSDLTSGINGAVAGGKVRIFDGTDVIDLVGFGTAVGNTNAPTGTNIGFTGDGFEGTSAAPAMTNTTSITRLLGVDTNNNSLDFTISSPTPVGSVVPEPTMLGVAALGTGVLLRRRNRKA